MHQLIKEFLLANLESDLKIKQARLDKIKELHVHKEEYEYTNAEVLEIQKQIIGLREEPQIDKLN